MSAVCNSSMLYYSLIIIFKYIVWTTERVITIYFTDTEKAFDGVKSEGVSKILDSRDIEKDLIQSTQSI